LAPVFFFCLIHVQAVMSWLPPLWRLLDQHSDNALKMSLLMRLGPHLPTLYRALRPLQLATGATAVACLASRRARRWVWWQILKGIVLSFRSVALVSAAYWASKLYFLYSAYADSDTYGRLSRKAEKLLRAGPDSALAARALGSNRTSWGDVAKRLLQIVTVAELVFWVMHRIRMHQLQKPNSPVRTPRPHPHALQHLADCLLPLVPQPPFTDAERFYQLSRMLDPPAAGPKPDHVLYLRQWFRMAPLSSIGADNVRDFLAWAWWSKPFSAIAPDERGVFDVIQQRLAGHSGIEPAPGFNPEVDCMKLRYAISAAPRVCSGIRVLTG
jgi:hypothetical protein